MARTYHRLESPTQTRADALRQEVTLRVCGRTARFGLTPCVKAYVGALPPGDRGIEFTTALSPQPGTVPHLALWYSGAGGVVSEADDLVCIPVTSFRNGQP